MDGINEIDTRIVENTAMLILIGRWKMQKRKGENTRKKGQPKRQQEDHYMQDTSKLQFKGPKIFDFCINYSRV